MYKKFDSLIKKLAWEYFWKFPPGYTSVDDLIQEGHLVLVKLMRKRYKPELGRFSTLLTTAVKNRYKDMLRTVHTDKRLSLTALDPYQDDITLIDQQTAHDDLERKEMIKKIRAVDEDLADLIEIGVTRELFIFARNRARNRALKAGRKLNKISFAQKVIEKFYGIDIKNIVNTIHSANE